MGQSKKTAVKTNEVGFPIFHRGHAPYNLELIGKETAGMLIYQGSEMIDFIYGPHIFIMEKSICSKMKREEPHKRIKMMTITVFEHIGIIFQTNNCQVSLQYAFRNKALALTGKPYVIVRQMDYNLLDDGSLIEPSIITNLRCDGVVEYVYEYYGYRVGGSINAWNIAINYSANRDAHASASVTPSTQRTLFLDVVTTTESDLY